MSAVSKKLTPASMQTSTNLRASFTSVSPHALKNSVPPPSVPVPKHKTGTCRPERPSDLNSMRAPYDEDFKSSWRVRPSQERCLQRQINFCEIGRRKPA